MNVRSVSSKDLLQLEMEGDIVRVIINGTTLIDMLRKFEIQFDPSLAGQYDYVEKIDFLKNAYVTSEEDDMLLVGCNCGEVGCWPMVAKVTQVEDVVMWSQFQQPYRKKWTYSKFGPFEFDANQYRKELNKISLS